MVKSKTSLRNKFKKLRDSLSFNEIEQKSRKITERVYSLKEFKKAKVIMLYISFGSEVNTEEMIKKTLSSGKKVVIPYIIDKKGKMNIAEIKKDYKKQLKKGAFGIMDLKDEYVKKFNYNNVEMVIVPGIVFDKEGKRIGFGGGYYDRFLKKMNKAVPLVGLAFESQVVKKIPFQKYDIGMNLIVTEKKVVKTGM